MHFYKKLKQVIYLSLLAALCMWHGAAMAGDRILIKSADLQAVEDRFELTLTADVDFEAEIEDAINKGVPLNFVIEFQITSPRKYWFDDEIVTATQNVIISFHALTRQYLVNRNGHQQSFASLTEAQKSLFMLSNWKVADKMLLEKNEPYNAALLIHLDHNKLPKVIQVDAIASGKWSLSSQKFEWPLKGINK